MYKTMTIMLGVLFLAVLCVPAQAQTWLMAETFNAAPTFTDIDDLPGWTNLSGRP